MFALCRLWPFTHSQVLTMDTRPVRAGLAQIGDFWPVMIDSAVGVVELASRSPDGSHADLNEPADLGDVDSNRLSSIEPPVRSRRDRTRSAP